jgi:hypothetical protein
MLVGVVMVDVGDAVVVVVIIVVVVEVVVAVGLEVEGSTANQIPLIPCPSVDPAAWSFI